MNATLETTPPDLPLPPLQKLEEIREKFKSIRHTDVLRADLEFSLAAAEVGGTNPEILALLKKYTEEVCDIVSGFEDQIIKDRQRPETQVLTTEQVEQEFQAHFGREQRFRDFVHEISLKFAPSENATAEQNRTLLELVTFYDKLAQKIDRSINLIVRENTFDIARAQRDEKLRSAYDPNDPNTRREGVKAPAGSTGPGFLERLIWIDTNNGGDRILYGESQKDLENLIGDIGKVRLGETVTAHPTELTGAKGVATLIEDEAASRAFVAARTPEELIGAAKRMLANRQELFDPSFNLINLDNEGRIKNFTPLDEIENARLPFMQRVRGLEESYRTFWRFMDHGWGDKASLDLLIEFKLNYELSSWVAPDIDGNFNKKSEHVLFETVDNAHAIIGFYAERLNQLSQAGIEVNGSWPNRITEAHGALTELRAQILAEATPDDLVLSQVQYNQALAGFNRILVELGNGAEPEESSKNFVSYLEEAYEDAARAKHPQARDALLLGKMAHSFGWHLARPEYRQTAEKHAEIIEHLLWIPVDGQIFDYVGKSQDERRTFLDEQYRADPHFLRRRVNLFMQKTGDGRHLRDTNFPEALTFHTIRIMQNLANQPHAARRMVLAEYEFGAHYMEALMLQKACPAPATGKSASLDTTPLVEKPATLSRWKQLFQEIVTTPTILEFLVKERGMRQYWQAAYSDNTRRFGITTRMTINEMWQGFPDYVESFCRGAYKPSIDKALQAVGLEPQDVDIKISPYHGSSLLRADHGGQRSSIATLKDHGLIYLNHLGEVPLDQTTQGRDNTAKLGPVEAVSRHITRIFSEGSQLSAAKRLNTEPQRDKASDEMVKMVGEALKPSQTDYTDDYASGPHGHELADSIVANWIEASEGNASSRATFRTGGNSRKNVYARGPNRDETTPVKQEAMRAITLSENQVNLGSRNSILGIHKVTPNLNEKFGENPKLANELQTHVTEKYGPVSVAFDENRHLTVKGFYTLASIMPAFRKHVDEIAFGGITSELAGYAQRQSWAEAQGKPMTAPVRQGLDNRRRDFMAGTELALKGFEIEPPPDRPEDDINMRVARRGYALGRFAMYRSSSEIKLSHLFGLLGTCLRDQIGIRLYREGQNEGVDKGDRVPTAQESCILRVLANERRTVSQPNAPTVNDFNYAMYRMKALARATAPAT